jgi:competence protein ComEA
MQHLRALARYRLRLAAIAFIIGAGLLGLQWASQRNSPPAAVRPLDQDANEPELAAEEDLATDPTAALPSEDSVIVYVSGAVSAPDVYELPAAARVKDLVVAAGGLAPEADPERINLAEPLKDGEHIHIPRQGETQTDSAPADAGTSGQGDLIDLNTAAEAELDGLPGIGQALASRIVEYRAENGPFKTVEDLRNVKGIGPALFASIAPLVTVGQ